MLHLFEVLCAPSAFRCASAVSVVETIHSRDAEVAETAQRKRHYSLLD